MTGPALPRLVRAALERVLPGDRRDDVLGDLEERYRQTLARRGRSAAARRVLREALALIAWGIGTRMRPRSPVRRTKGPRATGQTTWATDLAHDLRLGVRALRRQPAHAATVVVVLALGIGAPTTVLSLVDGIFLRAPAHVAEPGRLVRAYRTNPGQDAGSFGNPDYRYYRERASTLEGLAAWNGSAQAVSYTLSGQEPDQLDVTYVSDSFFEVLGLTPDRGRSFLPEEDATPGTHPVVVVSHGFWRRALGGDVSAVGRSISIAGIAFDVIGVAPDGFVGVSPVDRPPDAWMPIAMHGAVSRQANPAWWERHPNWRSSWLSVVGRLAPGVTHEAAEANLSSLAAALEYEGKGEDEGIAVHRQVLYDPGAHRTLADLSRLLLGAVAIVLLIAMANVAVLLLSRGTARGREMAVRAALGAGTGRLVRQLLAESLVLGALGGALGVAAAYGLADLAGALLPFRFVRSFTPGPRVLAAAVALSTLTALVVGMVPALRAARGGAAASSSASRATARGSRLRHALVSGQVGLSLVLLAGAVLFTRSFAAARGEPLGFATEDRLLVSVDLRALAADDAEGLVLVDRGLEAVRALPGVIRASTMRQAPFRGDWSVDLPAEPEGSIDDGRLALHLNAVSSDYFDAMAIPIVRGRGIEAGDRGHATPVIVVNEAFARAWWPGLDPLGRTVEIGTVEREVVGVARDATSFELGETIEPYAWLPLPQQWEPWITFVAHTAVDAPDLVPAAHAALRSVARDLAFPWTSTLEAVVEYEVARYEVSAILVSAFGLVAMLLAAAGLYGVVGFLVAQRTREIGVRMALGADRTRVAQGVVAFATRLTVVGVALGVAGALGVRRFTARLLYGVAPTDPVPLVSAALLLLAIAAVAAWAPARRATRVDPMEALRAE